MEGGLIVSPAPKSCAMIAQKACSFSKYDKEAEAANAKLEIGWCFSSCAYGKKAKTTKDRDPDRGDRGLPVVPSHRLEGCRGTGVVDGPQHELCSYLILCLRALIFGALRAGFFCRTK